MDKHVLMFLTLVTATLSHPVGHPGYEVPRPNTAGGSTQTRLVTQEEVVRTSGVQTNPGGIALPVQPFYQQGLPGQTVYQPGYQTGLTSQSVYQSGLRGSAVYQADLPAQPGYQPPLRGQGEVPLQYIPVQ